MNLPTDKQARKEQPVARGLLDYFPNALAEVAHVSYVGNEQHNPGQPLHWSRGKSSDHADCVARHLIERGSIDDDGLRHSAKMAWRALALLQLELEAVELSKPESGAVFLDMVFPGTNHETPVELSTMDFGVPQAQDNAQPEPSVIPEKYRGVWRLKNETTGCYRVIDAQQSVVYNADGSRLSGSITTFLRSEAEAIDAGGLVRVPSSVPTSHEQRRKYAVSEMIFLGCPESVAKQIAGGITFSDAPLQAQPRPWVYVAGPMRGYADFNFPAFDEARNRLVAEGYTVISPADIDRAAGDATSDNQTLFALRDFWSLYFIRQYRPSHGHIALLPGWKDSVGAMAEFRIARWIGLTAIYLGERP